MTDIPSPTEPKSVQYAIAWEKLPKEFYLPESSTENTAQPLIAGALRESLELAGYLQPNMLIASHLNLCAKVNGEWIIKAPDWFFVKAIAPSSPPVSHVADRRSYTPHLDGEVPQVVMEFVCEPNSRKYSSKRTFPYGRWFFYEDFLKVPIYIVFTPASGQLEIYILQEIGYRLHHPEQNNRYWLADMELFVGVWQGEKEGRSGYWLRWWDRDGNILPWAVEQIAQERQKVEKLTEKLRSLGIDPENPEG